MNRWDSHVLIPRVAFYLYANLVELQVECTEIDL